jgi:hypothetical protein
MVLISTDQITMDGCLYILPAGILFLGHLVKGQSEKNPQTTFEFMHDTYD